MHTKTLLYIRAGRGLARRFQETAAQAPFPTVSGKFPRRVPGHGHAWMEGMEHPTPQIDAGVFYAGLPSRKNPL